MENNNVNKTFAQSGYEQELEKIIALKQGETFTIDYYLSKVCLSRNHVMSRNQAIKYAVKNGYIESVSIYFDLYGNITKEIFQRL